MTITYNIDPAHSGVHFSVRHLMISTVRGSFCGIKGTVAHDSENPSSTTIDVEIDVDTVTTNDAKRDGHLKTADFFDVEKYPVMTFKSTGVTSGTSSVYTIAGNLTLHGVTKPVVLDVEEVAEQAKDPWGLSRVGVTAKSKLKRSDFDLVWNAPLETGGFVISDDVKIEFDIQLVKAA
jgi:polyisoprenoid-binding protein YceI